MNPTGLPMLLITLLLGFGAAVALFISIASGNHRMTKLIVRGAAVWGVAYGSILLTTSLTSDDRLLGLGEREAFCGFYLDCHLGATVLHTDRMNRIVLPDSVITTNNQFVLVDLLFDSDAQGASLHLGGARAIATDTSGTTYARRSDIEFEINTALDRAPTLDVALRPGQGARRILVFEVPEGAGGLRMHITKGNPIERLLEFFLIGDEDSFLHGRAYHRL